MKAEAAIPSMNQNTRSVVQHGDSASSRQHLFIHAFVIIAIDLAVCFRVHVSAKVQSEMIGS